ncbi:MAG: dTDP-4-dehydrorhamnose reductase [Gemmataceae bacterium]|nr:dTDP-4-dehydrorhamnose reductase [Gemmataceae bacterium]
MERMAILGSRGQLGRDLCPILAGEVFPLSRTEADLENSQITLATLDSLKPSLVVNCAAFNLVDKAEAEPEASYRVNAWGLKPLAMWCAQNNARLVHFSTDYVFGLDATRSNPYFETDLPGPVSQYGSSKLAGEFMVRTHCPNHLIIRTCGLYGLWGTGGKGGNFVETMLRLAAQGKPLRVVADQICTPSYTCDVAQAAAQLIQSPCTGIFHLTNSGECSWYEFAAEIFRQAGVLANLMAITSAEFCAPAKRPSYSVLNSSRLQESQVPPLRPWRHALAAYLQERKNRPN